MVLILVLHTGLPPLSIRIRFKQIKLVGPALCQEPVLCVGRGEGGWAAVNNIYKYLQGMYGSSSLCLSDTYALVIDHLIMIIIDEDRS